MLGADHKSSLPLLFISTIKWSQVKNRQLGTERMAKKLEFGTREVAWLLRAHVALPEDLNMVPSTRISGS